MSSERPAAIVPESERRYCFAACRDPWFNECADCWIDGGNPALYPPEKEDDDDGES